MSDDFDAPQQREAEPALIVDVDGFEGPLDLLLELARRQKVDLTQISILALVEQYLAFIEAARQLRLELAADYLVMAAWLAFLKSRLLLPAPAPAEEPVAEDLATVLALRLRRLEAIRRAAQQLAGRPRLGRDVLARGAPEEMAIVPRAKWNVSLFELLRAYTDNRQRMVNARVTLQKRTVWSLAEAREALQRLVGGAIEWTMLDPWLESYMATPAMRATVRASALSAMLEMVREGHVDIRQDAPFAPLMLRRRAGAPHSGDPDTVREVA
ncbi:segregation and condensation protein A [Pseudochelatococcus lubricantis]|uniref:Segregation and condensation protein A n=1 Tax=Pseudochelatococcus lubricantis TaxID=1538102 RepID=A0ABX0V134_9HYPH|nr:ScpA family protein [Pseudochelatococcus lubricantis]NIJ56811.1 segregation and condensation protein A [Pseudochelatococcus lubricantis]